MILGVGRGDSVLREFAEGKKTHSDFDVEVPCPIYISNPHRDRWPNSVLVPSVK